MTAYWRMGLPIAAIVGLSIPPTEAAELSIVGSWTSRSCEVLPDGGRSIIREFQFTQTRWRVEVAVHDGAACDMPMFGISVEGAYALTARSPRMPNAFEGTFFYWRKSAWALSERGVSQLEAAKCGTGNWRIGLEQDISDTGCMSFPKIASDCLQEFDLVSLERGELRFGRRSPAMCRPDGRPESLSADPLISTNR